MEKVTIGLPVYNCERYIEQTIRSVLAQDHGDWNLLVVDDGSTDRSCEIASSFSDKRIRILADGRNLKLNHRLNQIAALSETEFLFRMDADDIMHPERISATLAVLRNSPPETVAGTCAYVIGPENEIVGLRRPRLGRGHPFTARHSFIHPTVASRTAWFRANPYSGNFNLHRAQDAELWVRTRQTSRFVNLERPLLYYRDSGKLEMANYLGTQFGLMYLLWTMYLSGVGTHLWLLREIVKLYVVVAAAMLRQDALLVNRRNERLLGPELAHARADLARALAG
jgi:glycosyltransferase involved in cell wall biosynthesis